MTRSRQPDDPEPGTQTFSGPDVDRALQAARDAHGPQVEVVRAWRSTSGVRGLLGQVRYTVAVRPRPAPSVMPALLPEDPVGSALHDLLAAADAHERGATGQRIGEATWSWQHSEPGVGELLTRLGERGTQPATPHPALTLASHDGRALLDDLDRQDDLDRRLELDRLVDVGHPDAPAAAPADHQAHDPADDDPDRESERDPVPGAGWDRAELRRLGVPQAVLSHLPVEDPSDDAGWRRALQTAIAATVPPPAAPDAQHPVVVCGHGLLGAAEVLRAAVEDGVTPGTISSDGRHRPATPAALVDVLAARARS